MHSPSRNHVMIFNGEIYNHKHIRSQLDLISKRNWQGHSDTETLLTAIEEWGLEKHLSKQKECLQLLYGIRKQKIKPCL